MTCWYNVLLVILVTLAATCVPTSIATDVNLIQSGDSFTKEMNGNGFLRGGQETGEDVEVATDGEERSIDGIRKALGLYRSNLKAKTFEKMLNDDTFKAEMFVKWDQYKIPVHKIDAKMNRGGNPQFKTLLSEYIRTRMKLGEGKVGGAMKKAGEGKKNTVKWDLERNTERNSDPV
ncbi:hypothetical protein PHYBOEH_007758 [Phytophthora boehmeriae]|uniref:RxLR effector protein n=1 Tax=Phytophthora boehmeriae TaxID=109152 RepID=A0A8T1W5U1_9STRA|nr:hypothetical protein PHYBOEH_007758 [Phytophthora boehmeriae]